MFAAIFRTVFCLKRWQIYLVVVLVTLATFIAESYVGYTAYNRPLLIAFIPAICISSLLGGMVPGLVSTAIVASGVAYLYYPPVYSLYIEDKGDLIRLTLFVLSGCLVSFLSEVLHRALRVLQSERQALSESEKKFRTLTELVPVGVYITDSAGRCVYANPKWLDMTGLSLDQTLGTGWSQALHPDDRDAVFKAWAQMVASRGDWGMRYRFRTPGGTISWVYGTAVEMRDETGRVRGYIGATVDVTARVKSESALQESENRYTSLVVSAPVGVILQTADGIVRTWNPMTRDIFGIPEDEVVGRDARTIAWQTFRPDGTPWPGDEHPSMVTLKTGRPCRDVVMRVVAADGQERWVSINTEPIVLAGEAKPHAVVITVNDVTEHKREEQFREDVDRIIRHDIKTPLISIFSMAQLAKMDKLKMSVQEMIPQIEHGIRQVLRLVDSSDKIKKMERGEYAPRMEPFDMRAVLANVKDTLAVMDLQRDVQVLLQTLGGQDEPGALCVGEQHLIEDMLLNLVKNAVEATAPKGVVTVSHGLEKGRQVVRIHNRGGLSAAVRNRFFDKYFSAGKTHGSGLGTYSAQLIARAHGGNIGLDASDEEGVTVTVTLPCGEKQA